MRDVPGHRLARGGEDHAAVFFVFHQPLGIEPLDHGGDARLGNFQLRGDVDNAGVALALNQLPDALQIVLDRGRRAGERSTRFCGHAGKGPEPGRKRERRLGDPLFLGGFLGAIDDAEHLDGEPEHAADAGGGEGGPERDELRVVRWHVNPEQREHEREEADHEDRINDQTGGGDELGFGLSHGRKKGRERVLVHGNFCEARPVCMTRVRGRRHQN